jgi:hypothetical protein
MSSTLDRINKLVALAGSSNENEARNAAVQACKLILQHKIVLSHPVSARPPPAPEPVRNVRTPGGADASPFDMNKGTPVDLGEIFDGLFGKQAGNTFRQASQKSPEAYTMDAPQEGTCRDCGDGFNRGERIWYRRGVGAVHAMRCNPDILNRKSPPR